MKNFYFCLSLLFTLLFAYLFNQPEQENLHSNSGLSIAASSSSFGIILNITLSFVYCAFGTRISKNVLSIRWFYLQLLLNSCLLTDDIISFTALLVAALLVHISISSRDTYQSIRPAHHFQILRGFSLISAILVIVFCCMLAFDGGYSSIREIHHISSLSFLYIFTGSVTLIMLTGVFPFHFWVRPAFLAPTRYGLAAIMRLFIGFVFWCKFGFLLNIVFTAIPIILLSLLGVNLIYSALILFAEKKLSGIAASLYQWHVSLFLLGGLVVHEDEKIYSMMDFFNTSICISTMMIVISMIRDRVGADKIDSASGLAISFPSFGLAFLFCVLSLIGFPGTIGFVSSVILLHCLGEAYWPVAGCFVIALTLNGYSCFRIFGDTFYGHSSLFYPKEFQPKFREKLTLVCLIAIILIAGIKPELINNILRYF